MHHVLKVITDYSKEVTIAEDPEGYRIDGRLGANISWRKISDKEEMEKHLKRRNKRHLQHMEYKESPPSRSYFDDILSEYGTYDAADNLLDIRAWLRRFRRTNDELECLSITGMIHTDEFMEAFRSVREKTSSSPSDIHYTFWKCMASDRGIVSYLVSMMRLPFMYGFTNDRWEKCLDVMLVKTRQSISSRLSASSKLISIQHRNCTFPSILWLTLS
ncbi:LOW QUALITY PROTEIN: hypothetical protein ACHAWF_001502 [Thalassiosira exigua]